MGELLISPKMVYRKFTAKTNLLVQGACVSLLTVTAAGSMLQRTQTVVTSSFSENLLFRWSPKWIHISELLRFHTWNDLREIYRKTHYESLIFKVPWEAYYCLSTAVEDIMLFLLIRFSFCFKRDYCKIPWLIEDFFLLLICLIDTSNPY